MPKPNARSARNASLKRAFKLSPTDATGGGYYARLHPIQALTFQILHFQHHAFLITIACINNTKRLKYFLIERS